MTTHYTDLEVNLNGLTFTVSGTYYPYEAGTELNPPCEAEFELDESRLEVKGQPEADPFTILEEMRGSIYIHRLPDGTSRIDWNSGFEQLADKCLRIVSGDNGVY